ncbi:hypothetical protein GGG16DRAFT_128846 [Schizophyllum commune]
MEVTPYTKETFLTFPDNAGSPGGPALSAEAREDIQRYGYRAACLREWRRTWLEPTNLYMRELCEDFDETDPGVDEVVAFSLGVLSFLDIMDDASKDPEIHPVLNPLLEAYSDSISVIFTYWSTYNDYMEPCGQFDSDLSDPSIISLVRAWFSRSGICFDTMLAMFGSPAFNEMQRTIENSYGPMGDDGERYWRIFLMGLVRFLQNGGKCEWPSQTIREIDRHETRFLLAQKALGLKSSPIFPSYSKPLDMLKDPVSTGRLFGYQLPPIFDRLTEQDRARVLAKHITVMIYFVFFLHSEGFSEEDGPDMMGAQAVASLLDVHTMSRY